MDISLSLEILLKKTQTSKEMEKYNFYSNMNQELKNNNP